ncbi:MAG TPA: carboxypeptidase regulatory-like domain-containing protein [Pyrinomonadaceae bacterium]|jgi:hypothetical protein|nr:carboxypeptidase regulatory-like domain-containing protein [Pyrinomonadaceae bacterium]
MKRRLFTDTTKARSIIRRFVLARTRSRLAAFLVLALVAVGIGVSTLASAQRRKQAKRAATVKTSDPKVLNRNTQKGRNIQGDGQVTPDPSLQQAIDSAPRVDRNPKELRMVAARSFTGDLRSLPYVKPVRRERFERDAPEVSPVPFGIPETEKKVEEPKELDQSRIVPAAPAPTPLVNFLGLDFATWGSGRPPDTVGDVGPNYYIQAVNTSIGVYNKTGGAPVAAFTFDTFMSQGNFGNICDTDNGGDPVVLYDSFEDRWIITDLAYTQDISGNILNPPGAFQCIAASKTSDPVAGGWNFYSINTTGGLGDYPKLGIWPDGLYMSVNMFDYPAAGAFQTARTYAFNKAQMYAGSPTVQVVSFDVGGGEFALVPSNARLQVGTPPTGTPNYFNVVWLFSNAVSTYKFHVDWNSISLSTMTGPFITIAPASWASPAATVPAQGGNNNDTLGIRLMMQNQYTRMGGVESMWTIHTVQGSSAAQTAVRYYQVNVTGGTVAATTAQAFTHNPDATINRYMPSLAVDRAGNMALGYSASSASLFPAIRYAGRLSTDPVNTLPLTETVLVAGTGSQNTSTRWGDYSAMTLDPNGCTFWYTNEYFITTGGNWQTRVGSFQFTPCTTVGNGSVQGTVTVTPGGAPLSGATVALGSRTTTTDAVGFYSFSAIPAGTYPTETASKTGYNSSTVTGVVVTDGNITTQNFALSAAATSGCFVDTSQADFQLGLQTNVDVTTSPGDVTLLNAANIDQQNTTLGNQGLGFNNTTWIGQTFTPAVTGQLARVDFNFFSLNCGAVSMPNLTVSIRNAAGNLPTGADLAVATIPGFCNGGSGYFTAIFASPATLTSGTQYAIVARAAAAIPGGAPAPGYFGTVSVGAGSVSLQNPYAGGRRASSANSGATWAGAAGNANNDHGFKVYMKTGFTASGNQVSNVKDANPIGLPTWGVLSWTATVPANTTLKFQAAGSNSASGPFNFVGPDSTSGTFFTNGGSLAQFNGNRYLKYKAFFTTTNSAVTPTLNDVSVCFAVCGGNVALASNNATATASSQINALYPASGVNNGEHDGHDWGAGGGWNDGTPAVFPDTVGINLGVSQSISEIDVYTLKDDWYSQSFVNDSTTFTQFGITNFQVQYWNGAAFVDVPGGNVTGNNLVKRKFNFPAITTDRIQVVVNASADNYYSRVVEIEAYSCTPQVPPTPTPTPTPVASPTPNPCAIPADNVALASNGSTAVASSTANASFPATGVIDGEHNGNNWGSSGGWNDNTAAAFPDDVQVNFNVSQTINEIDVYTLKDDFNSGSTVTDTTTFASYGITNFNVQYWTGAVWTDVPGGAVTGNNLVKRKFLFTPIATDRIRVLVNNSADSYYSRVVEIEAFSCTPVVAPTPTPTPVPCNLPANNVALASNGGSAVASSIANASFPAAGAIDGEHNGNNWGAGGGWNDGTGGVFPDDTQVNFSVAQTIKEIDVYTLKDDFNSGSTVNDLTTFTGYGITNFNVQYWTGAAWADVPGGAVTGNNLVKRKFTFADITTDRIRIVVNNAADGYYSRVVEIEAFSCTPLRGSSKGAPRGVQVPQVAREVLPAAANTKRRN